jgi:hypothetical protein
MPDVLEPRPASALQAAWFWPGLLGGAVLLALAIVMWPRAVAPIAVPALTLSEAEVAEVLRSDAKRAAAAPPSDVARALAGMFVEYGQSELTAIEDLGYAKSRQRAMHVAYTRLVAANGQDAAWSVRERALLEFEAGLDGKVSEQRAKGLMGLFANVLEQYMATRDGEELAPHFVIRTLYKARWNKLAGLALDEGFARVELQAYHGWLGLHAENLPLPVRRQALQKYAAAGGAGASEAQGVLAFLSRDFAKAAELLGRAYAQAPSLRLRNYRDGARAAAAQGGRPLATR